MIQMFNNQRGISTIIIVAIVAVLSLGGIGAYVATDGFGTNDSNHANNETSQESNEQTEQQDQPATTSIALLEKALASGSDVKCTYEQEGNSGTAFIDSENRFRVDYTSTDGSGHLVYTDNTMYVWSDNESKGFKITNPKERGEELSEQYGDYSPENLKDTYSEENIDCQTFTFADDLVQLPSGVEFMSFEEMFQNQ